MAPPWKIDMEMKEFNLLEENKRGWSFHGIDIKTGRFITFRKFHYFKNGVSIDRKYKQLENDSLLPIRVIMIYDLYKADYRKYKEMCTMNEVKKYRKKPIIIQAIQYTGNNWKEIKRFIGIQGIMTSQGILIKTLEGDMLAQRGDYVIKGIKGEFYPCKEDIFKKTYEEVEEGIK